MIKFEHANGDIRQAVFAGGVADLCTDISVAISLVYGALHHQDEESAESFRFALLTAFAFPAVAEKIFSAELYDAIMKDDNFASSTMAIKDRAKFERQLKELLNEDE